MEKDENECGGGGGGGAGSGVSFEGGVHLGKKTICMEIISINILSSIR